MKMVGSMLQAFEDFEDFLEYIDIAEEENREERVAKRYIRDAENPMDFLDEIEFRTRYRFHKDTVLTSILPLVIKGLRKPDNRGLPIPPILQVLICLRFYASGNFDGVSDDLPSVSQPTISVIIRRVSILIAESLHEFIRFPLTAQGFQSNSAKFKKIANFPGVSGCITCTHIKIRNPGGDHAEVFRNSDGYFSLKVQVVSGPEREILDIVVQHPGSSHDSLIFDRSALRVRMETGDIPGILIGHNGYACRHYFLTPVLEPDTEQQIRYNTALIKTKDVVERLFETWKRRFPGLQRGLQTKLETTLAIICATAVLHNIGLRENEDFEEDIGGGLPTTQNVNDVKQGLDFQRHFIQQYFA